MLDGGLSDLGLLLDFFDELDLGFLTLFEGLRVLDSPQHGNSLLTGLSKDFLDRACLAEIVLTVGASVIELVHL